MRRVLAALTVLAFATPAVAQQTTATFNVSTMADCQANFQAVDRDGNGAISRDERQVHPNAVPTAVSDRDSIDRQSYLDACRLLITQHRQ